MASLRALFSQTAIYGLSATLARFISFALMPYFTRVMETGVYGDYTYFYALIPFANVLLTMGMATGLIRHMADAQTVAERSTLFSTLWATVSLVAVVACAAVVPWAWNDPSWLLVIGIIALDNMGAIPMASLRVEGRGWRYSAINLTNVVITVGLSIFFYQTIDGAAQTPFWALLANLIASGVVLLLLTGSVRHLITRNLSKKTLAKVARYSLPLMLAGVMGISSDFIDRQLLKWILPEGDNMIQLGLYGSVAKLASLLIIFRQFYSLGAEPFFLQKMSGDDFRRLNAASLNWYTAFGLFFILGLCLYNDVVALILGPAFRVGMDVLPVLLVANLFSGLLVNLSFWYKVADKTRLAVWVTLVGVVVNVVLNLLVIPVWGYHGSAWARLVSALATVVVCYALGQKYLPVPYNLGRVAGYFLVAGAIFTVGLLIESWPMGWRWSTDFLLLLTFGLWVVYKEELWQTIKKSRSR